MIRYNKGGSYPRFDLGKNFIYKNRYVVSGAGDVIDIQQKQLVIRGSDHFIDTTGDSIIFYRQNLFTEKGYMVLNLKDNSYQLVKDARYRRAIGLLSPNLKYGIEVDTRQFPYRILLSNNQNDFEAIVNGCGTGTDMLHYTIEMTTVPLFWVDTANFLYADYETYSTDVTIRKVNIETKLNEPVGVIKNVLPDVVNGKFSFDPNRDILFECKAGVYKVDTRLKTLEIQKYTNYGNNFTTEKEEARRGAVIRYKNKKIGRFWHGYEKPVTTDGYFAAEYYGRNKYSEKNTKCLKIWSAEKEKWISLDMPGLDKVIGWVE